MLFLCDCYDQLTWSHPTRWNACLACILMQSISDVARLVRLVVLVVSLFPFGSYFLLFPTFSDITFPPICATSCCGRSLSVLSLSEMLNALLISSFYDWFQQFPVLFDWFQHSPVLFDWFQQFPVSFDWFQHFPVLFDWFQQFPVLFDWFHHYPVF